MSYAVTLIPGDGIGPELAEAARQVLEATGIGFDWDVQQAGEATIASEGTAAVFVETHEDPGRATSDGPNMVEFDRTPGLIAELMAFDRLAKAHPL